MTSPYKVTRRFLAALTMTKGPDNPHITPEMEKPNPRIQRMEREKERLDRQKAQLEKKMELEKRRGK